MVTNHCVTRKLVDSVCSVTKFAIFYIVIIQTMNFSSIVCTLKCSNLRILIPYKIDTAESPFSNLFHALNGVIFQFPNRLQNGETKTSSVRSHQGSKHYSRLLAHATNFTVHNAYYNETCTQPKYQYDDNK